MASHRLPRCGALPRPDPTATASNPPDVLCCVVPSSHLVLTSFPPLARPCLTHISSLSPLLRPYAPRSALVQYCMPLPPYCAVSHPSYCIVPQSSRIPAPPPLHRHPSSISPPLHPLSTVLYCVVPPAHPGFRAPRRPLGNPRRLLGALGTPGSRSWEVPWATLRPRRPLGSWGPRRLLGGLTRRQCANSRFDTAPMRQQLTR